jgi:hypothetical protein
MREHYGLDRLADYRTKEISETTRVVNPVYRDRDGKVRRKVAILNRKLAQFGGMGLKGEIAPKNVGRYERKKAALQEEITQLQTEVDQLKASRKEVPRHITAAELPEEYRFTRLSTDAKHFIDTTKMIAYRAETALVHVLREQMARNDDARTLIRTLFRTDADIIPDEKAGTLTVRLHHLASQCSDETLRHLCRTLNETETHFPGTDLKLIYELVSSGNPADQEV